MLDIKLDNLYIKTSMAEKIILHLHRNSMAEKITLEKWSYSHLGPTHNLNVKFEAQY